MVSIPSSHFRPLAALVENNLVHLQISKYLLRGRVLSTAGMPTLRAALSTLPDGENGDEPRRFSSSCRA
jgi:hypothetical protein